MQLPSPLGQNQSLPQQQATTQNHITVFSAFAANQRRWVMRSSANPETGANAGSDLVIDAFDDNGNNLGNAAVIERRTPGNHYHGRKVVPPQDTGAIQAGNFYGIFAGTGVPNNANGVNGDYYFRGDTPGVANQRVYIKSAGAWVGIV